MGPGAVIELPLLSQNQGGRARAAAEVEQAARRYVAVRAAVGTELRTAMVGLNEARRTAQLLGDDVAASLATARQQAERLYTAGEISLLDLLATRQRLMDIETNRVDAAFAVNRAIVRVEQALGHTCAPR
jgi:outer membrane protein TolC